MKTYHSSYHFSNLDTISSSKLGRLKEKIINFFKSLNNSINWNDTLFHLPFFPNILEQER